MLFCIFFSFDNLIRINNYNCLIYSSKKNETIKVMPHFTYCIKNNQNDILSLIFVQHRIFFCVFHEKINN